MKVTELLLEKSPLAHSPSYDFKTKSILGAAEDWFKALGVTPADIKEALLQIRKTEEYKKIADRCKPLMSAQSDKFGTLVFTLEGQELALISAMGQIRYQANRSGFNRGRQSSLKPRVVVGNPVAGLVKTYKAALVELAKKPKIANLLK